MPRKSNRQEPMPIGNRPLHRKFGDHRSMIRRFLGSRGLWSAFLSGVLLTEKLAFALRAASPSYG